jgi:hypothetical protein
MKSETLEDKKISISRLKHSFAKKFPSSPILQTLLSMRDEIPADELIGAVGVWLNILDIENHNNLDVQRKIKEAMK